MRYCRYLLEKLSFQYFLATKIPINPFPELTLHTSKNRQYGSDLAGIDAPWYWASKLCTSVSVAFLHLVSANHCIAPIIAVWWVGNSELSAHRWHQWRGWEISGNPEVWRHCWNSLRPSRCRHGCFNYRSLKISPRVMWLRKVRQLHKWWQASDQVRYEIHLYFGSLKF